MNERVARRLRAQAHNEWNISKYKDQLSPKQFVKAIKRAFYRKNKD